MGATAVPARRPAPAETAPAPPLRAAPTSLTVAGSNASSAYSTVLQGGYESTLGGQLPTFSQGFCGTDGLYHGAGGSYDPAALLGPRIDQTMNASVGTAPSNSSPAQSSTAQLRGTARTGSPRTGGRPGGGPALSGDPAAGVLAEPGSTEPGRNGPDRRSGGRAGGRGPPRARGREHRHTAPPPARFAVARTGTASVERDSVQLAVAAPAYPGGARLAVQPAATPAADKAQRQRPADMPDYRGEFAAAVAAGGRLYERILAGAREIASEAREQNEQLGRHHQQVLSTSLRNLDDRLAFDRTSLRIGRDNLLMRLNRQADMIRGRIAAAAGAAYGRLAAKRARYQTEIDGLVGTGDAIVARATSGVSAVDTKARAAEFSLQVMHDAIPGIYADEGFPKWRARNEAIRTYLPPRVARLRTNIANQRQRLVESLNSSFACLQCNVDSSRQAFRYATEAVELPARRAIDAAAAGGRKAVDDAVEQLELAIHESYGRADSALVEQHDSMRSAAIAAAQGQGRQERAELVDTASRQVSTLTAVAGAQAQAIHRVKATLEKDSALSEPMLAGVVARASQRLTQNMEAVAAVHPRTTLEAARKLRGGRGQRAAGFDQQQEATAVASRRGLDRIVEQSLGAVERHVEESLGRLYPVAASVRASANSSLQPLDDAFFNGLADYRDSLAALSNSVDSAFSRHPAAAVRPSPKRPPPPTPPAARSRAAPTGAAAAPAAPVPAPPDSCQACPPAGNPGNAAPNASGTAEPGPLVCSAGTNSSQAPPAPSSGGGGAAAAEPNFTPAPVPNSPEEFNRTNDEISLNPFAVEAFTSFVDGVYDKVEFAIEDRVEKIHRNMSVMSSNRGPIIEQLNGITALQGAAIEDWYNALYDPDVRPALNDQLRSIWAAGSTDDANVREAIQALEGHAGESGFSALTAAFNYSNDFDRARLTLLNMTPQQVADMRRDHGAELTGFANELYGQEREIFQALIDGHPEAARAMELRRDLDRNDYKQAEERGDANAALVDAALRDDHHQAIYSDRRAAYADLLGLEDRDIAHERSEARLQEMHVAFGLLPGVIEMGGGTSSDMAGSALFRYATRTVDFNLDYYRRYPPPPGSPAERRMRELENQPNPYSRRDMLPMHRLMIEQSLRHGVDSNEARAARLFRERRRTNARPDLDGMEGSLHVGSGDSREGGGYNGADRARGLEEANRRRAEIFLLSERFRFQLEGGAPPPANAADAQESVRRDIMNSYPRDERARAVALGIVNSEEGDLGAVVEHAAHTENSELLNRYLGRRDRREIERFTNEYNRHNKVPLEQRLGLFEHHWSAGNMNGAVFSGDTANALEIAWMGVPQHDRERGEVALRVMNQTIDQAGGLGSFLAGGEMATLQWNAARLREAMGVSPDEVDSHGRIKTRVDPGTGLEIHYGHFDENGNLRQEYAGDRTAFNVAAGMARTYSSSYTEATDRIASYITTALVVAAAVITTALTGGAAASLWIPMLVTAGAGLVGMGLTAAVKGGRYGRDEMVRDLAMTVVQTLTAGIGAAGSIAARGGLPALKMVASQGIRTGFRISERALEQALLKQGVTLAASASLGAELAIGAASGALSGGVTAAFDPANRGEDFWSNVAGGIGRGAVGGAIGAGAARGISAGLGGVGQRLTGAAASRSARSALNAGLSREQAIERALLAARRANYITGGATRAIAGGASGSMSRMAELGLEGKMSFEAIMAEGRSTFIQGVVQGALEHGADPSSRNSFRRGNARVGADELGTMTRHQLLEHLHLAQSVTGIVDEHYNPKRPAGADVAPSRPGAPVRPPPGPEPQVHAEGAVTTRLTPAPEGPQPLLGRPEITEGGRPRSLRSGEDEAMMMHSILAKQEGEGIRRSASEEDRPLFRSAVDDEAEGPITRRDSIADADPDSTSPGLRWPTLEEQVERITAKKRASTRDDPEVMDSVYVTADLTKERLAALPGDIPADSEIRATDPHSATAALENYHALREHSAPREVLLAWNPNSNQYVVLQGVVGGAKPMGGEWITLRHSHPEAVSMLTHQEMVLHALPSGRPGDFGSLMHEAAKQAARPENGGVATLVSAIDVSYGSSVIETKFMVTHRNGEVELQVAFRNPSTGETEHIGPVRSLQEYSDKVYELTAHRMVIEENSPVQRTHSIEGAAIRRGDAVPVEQRGAARSVAQRAAEAAGLDAPARAGRMAEIHEMVRAMGLVGQSDSLARLTNLLNVADPEFTPAMRAAVANATLEATRAELIRTGALAPGDDVLMLFRGVASERMSDYEREGMNLARLGPGGDEDAGRGLYGSQDYESALRYTGETEGGQVLPLIVRKSELGNIVDVRSGTPLGDRWLAFIRASRPAGKIVPGYDHLNGVLVPGLAHPIATVRDGRGTRFEQFLASVAADPSLPDSVRAAARDPHITLMDLGGVASTGNDRSMLTDQWAMHSQRIADLFNEAHGLPRFGQGTNEEGQVMRSALHGSGNGSPATGGTTNAAKTSTDPPPAGLDHFDQAVRLAVEHGGKGVPAELLAALPRLGDISTEAVARYFLEPSAKRQAALLASIGERLAATGMEPQRMRGILRELVALEAQAGARTRVIAKHLEDMSGPGALPAVSTRMKQAVEESPALAALATRDPNLFQELEDTYFHNRPNRSQKGRDVEASLMRSLAQRGRSKSAAMAQRAADARAMLDLLRPLLPNVGDFKVGLAAAVHTVRGEGDFSSGRGSNQPDPSFDNRVPLGFWDRLDPGMRVDHREHGRGTVARTDGDRALIIFSAGGENVEHWVRLSDLDTFRAENSTGERVPEVVKLLTPNEQQVMQGRIDDARVDAGVRPFSKETEAGTISIARGAGMEAVGSNSTLAARTVTMTHAERNEMVVLLRKMGIDTDNTLNDPRFVHHAELASLFELRAELRAAGKGVPEVVELFVDRATCDSCSQNLSLVAAYLGIAELRIYTRGNVGRRPTIIRAR